MRTGRTMKSRNVKQILHDFMNVNIGHWGTYCDRRILAMGFVDISYVNDATGSVMKKINGIEYTIYCPNATEDKEMLSHEDFLFYSICSYDGKKEHWLDRQFTAEEVIAYIKRIEVA